MDLDLLTLSIILVAGLVTGVINTLAGSGSLVTLPIFIFLCGLPPTVANGTNRIGVLVQSAVAVLTFRKHGNLPLDGVIWLIGPAVLGAIGGSQVAVELNEDAMNLAIGFLMVFMLGVLFIKPARWLKPKGSGEVDPRRWLNLPIFFLIGFYGGFIQAGVGIFLLAALVMVSGYDLVKANGIKLLAVFIFNIPALINFLAHDQVNWYYGLIMAAAQAVGALIGARFANRYPHANVWIRWLLIIIVVASAAKFLWPYIENLSQYSLTSS